MKSTKKASPKPHCRDDSNDIGSDNEKENGSGNTGEYVEIKSKWLALDKNTTPPFPIKVTLKYSPRSKKTYVDSSASCCDNVWPSFVDKPWQPKV